MPPPAARAISRSRSRRIRLDGDQRSISSRFSMRRGNQRSPSRISTVVTTSTESCVRARSGAENQTKVMQQTSPAPPSSVNAASRWYLACHAAPTAQAAPSSHSSTKAGDAGSSARSPGAAPRVHKPAAPATTARPTNHISCACSRRVPSSRRPVRARTASVVSTRWKMRWPSSRPTSGARTMLPLRSCARTARYTTMPPPSATRLIANGRLKPCQTARLYSGSVSPTTANAAVPSTRPIDSSGTTPTTRQASTSNSTGTRIQCGGSWGVWGRSVARGPKNTSTVKRSE